MLKKQLKELLEFAQKTDLQEVIWEKKDALISFRRSGLPAQALEAQTPTASRAPAKSAKSSEPMTIKSTMVGTFYRSDSLDRPPLVVEGTIVNAGQPVAAIEAMKIMKDVVAQSPCRIVKALVANGHAVEYGQPLFEVEPAPDNV
jgi:acetyl-CoA carboxylase biotin carboxyl carrier protein